MRNHRPLLAPAVLSVALLQMLPAAAGAGDSEFHSLVERMSDYYQKRPMRHMGWLNFFANRFTPGGVSDFQMAIFADVDASRAHPSEDLESSLASLVGPLYQPFVNVHDVRSGEWTCIYTREAGKERIEMLILTIDSSDAVLMKMQLKPEAMRKWVEDPLESGRNVRRGAQDAERGQP
ncbi:MAG: hypothetical protein ABSH52_00480 [Terriglobia bacterium]